MNITYKTPAYMNVRRDLALDKVLDFISDYDSRRVQDLIRGGWEGKIRHQVQAGIVAKLVAAFSSKAERHIVVYGSTPFIFTGRYYAPISNENLEDIHFEICQKAGFSVQEWHDQDYSRRFFDAVATECSTLRLFGPVRPKAGILFQDGFLTVDGTLHADIKAEWLCMYEVQCKWQREAPTNTRFMEVVNHAVDGQEERNYMLASFGNAIAGDPLNAQRALLLVGLGGTGKSSLQDAVSNVVGAHNRYDVDSISQLSEKGGLYAGPTEYATLCIAADSSANVKQVDTIKKFISKESVTSKELYRQPRTIIPRAAIIAGSNDAQIERLLHDDGIFRRFDIIGFYNQVTTRDNYLHEKLAKETADIGWLLADALLHHSKSNGGRLERPSSLKARLENARDEGDVISSALSQMGCRIARKGNDDNVAWVYWPDIKDNVMQLAKEDGYEVKAMQIKAKLKAAGPNSTQLAQPFSTNRYAYYRLEILDADTFRSFNTKQKTF